jgi:hypothetical protein
MLEYYILFHSREHGANEWEGPYKTKREAVENATSNNRHFNYGRNGFVIIEGKIIDGIVLTETRIKIYP